jgi:hypothetical protein
LLKFCHFDFIWLHICAWLFFAVLQQLLVLETSLVLNGLNFHDQHRDMRLDIDNMSYEVCECVIITHAVYLSPIMSLYFPSFLALCALVFLVGFVIQTAVPHQQRVESLLNKLCHLQPHIFAIPTGTISSWRENGYCEHSTNRGSLVRMPQD